MRLGAGGPRRSQREYEDLGTSDIGNLRRPAAALGLRLICACDPAYPPRLRDLTAPPAVLHIARGAERLLTLCAEDSVAIVGSRRASEYGRDVAGALARGVATAGLTVVSGMASGVDSAAHAGALAGGGGTIAVLPGSAHLAVPASNRALHARIVSGGVAVSELGPGVAVRNWSFVARNRIIAALGHVAVVVQGGTQSGALRTIELAHALGRPVGAVPGAVTSEMSDGPNELLAHRKAVLISGPQDLLDLLAQARGGVRRLAPLDQRPPLTPQQEALLEAISGGASTLDEVVDTTEPAAGAFAELAALEIAGWVRRGMGGRYTVLR